jgi:hypothetical protein
MDERWDIGKAGLSTFIHADPLGNPLVSIQDMQNQLANLSIQTVDQGNPTMFADPETLNFGQVDTFQSVPGAIHRAKPAAGRTLAESFYTTQKVTLGKEVPVLKQQLDQTGQFVIGSFPSIYGGPSEGKSRTLGEYSQSRAMALQRLQIVWKFIVDWWKSTMTGAVRMYVDTVVEDQRFVTQKEGGYVNTWIRTSELKGKIGSVESDADEKFPVSAAQISAMLMKMIELNNPNINAGLYIPENLEMLRDAFGMSTFTIPGADQRLKQLRELENLSKGIPVTIDTLIDDDAVHIEIVKNFCISPSGMEMKDAQPEIYQTILQHLQMHNANMAAKTMQMQNNSMPGQQVPTAQGPAK